MADALASLEQNKDMQLLFEVLDMVPPAERREFERILRRWTGRPVGGSKEAWRAWWEANRDKERFVRLLAGLVDAPEKNRKELAAELADWVGRDLGFEPGMSKEQVEELVLRYRKWWLDNATARSAPPTDRQDA